jgi:two-component system, sensor histidine kinase and response regulator
MNQELTFHQPEQQVDLLLRQSEERFRQLIKNSFDMIVLIGADGTQHYVSESCEKILGYKPEELMNISVIETLIHPDDRENTLKGLHEIVDGRGVGGAQYRHRHKNGHWVYLEAFGTNQLDNPAVQGVVLNVRDITERKKIELALQESEARLEALNAAKDKFFSIIAHDLKSPFTSILGFSELLVEQLQEKDYEDIGHYATGIQLSAQRTLDLLTNLLEWSRSQTGRMEFSPKQTDMVRLVKEVARLAENSAKQKGIVLYWELPPVLPVYADKAMVSTILRNLITNGIKFTRPGGGVKISACYDEENVVVSVSDTGTGIKQENLEKLFKMGENTSTPGTYKEQGTGLGLLLCKEFVEKHGGNIWAESEAGNGSTFYFYIPAVKGTNGSQRAIK